jgi:hypothetical protein
MITVFLFAFICLTHRRPHPLWKYSPLALVESQHGEGAVASSFTLSEDAKYLLVQIRRSADRWKLERVD